VSANIDLSYQNSFDINGNGLLTKPEMPSIQLTPKETIGSYISSSSIEGNSASKAQSQSDNLSYQGTDIKVNGVDQTTASKKEENHLSAEELAVINDVMNDLAASGALGGLIKSEVVQPVDGKQTLIIQCGVDITGNGVIDNLQENSMITLEQKENMNSLLDILRQFPGLEGLNNIEKYNDQDRNLLEEFGIKLTNNMGEGV